MRSRISIEQSILKGRIVHIPCPHCGPRDSSEFVYRGDAAPSRPADDADMFAYVYLRDNPAGMISEHWYHAQGCRNWIVVARNTVTHDIAGSAFPGEVTA